MSGAVFISYQRADAELARYFAERLEAYGAKAWWDSAIAPGDDWRESIAEGLERASAFVVLHSAAAEKSPEVKKEIAAASALGKPIIAARLENRKPSGVFLYEMSSLNWVEAYQDPSARLDELARRLAATDLARTSRLGIAAAVDARPIRRSRWSRLTGSSAAVAGIWAAAVMLGFAAMNALGEGFASMATETGATLTDLLYALGGVVIGAPILVVRFILRPPASPGEAALLIAAMVIVICYAFLVRNLLRYLQRMSARRGRSA